MRNWLLLCLMVAGLPCLSQSAADKNIAISTSRDQYRFEMAKSGVVVRQELSNIYISNKFRGDGLFYEFFDDQSTLDNIELVENGKKSNPYRELKPYAISGIFYSDAMVFEMPLNFQKAGWQNEVRMKKTVLDPRYFCTVYFSDIYPVEQKEVVITIPRWMKVEIREMNFEGYEITKSESYNQKQDVDVYQYRITNLAERKRESNQPGPSFFLPHLLIMSKYADYNGQHYQFFNTLQDQYNWYRKMVSELKTGTAIVKTKALEITEGITTDMEKIRAVLYWVYNNIRYVAFEDGIAGFKPDEAHNVLEKKFGDCKGMANLTRELLKALGFDARLAWIGTNHIAYDYSTPSLCVDNHMICCLIYDGKKYFLDGTETYLAFGKYAERIQGRQVLIENGDQFILDKVPSFSPEQNLTHFKENVRIEDGHLVGEVEYNFLGESKEQLLHSIHSSKKESVNIQLERYIANDNKNYQVSGIRSTDFEDIDGALNISFDINFPGAVSAFGNEIYVDLDYNKTFNQHQIDTSKRQTDYVFPYKYNYLTEVELEVPEGYTVSSLPESFNLKHPDYTIELGYKKEGDKVVYRKRISLNTAVIKKTAITEWNNAMARLSAKYLDQVILIKK